MRNSLLYCTLALLCFCCLVSMVARSQLQKIYLHPKAPGKEKQSKFVDSVRFIPLEIKEGISLGAYNNVSVTERYFLIIDYASKTMLMYSKQGNFIKKINYKNLGESFYPAYHETLNQITFFGTNKNYALTPKDRIKIKLDWNNPRNKKYFKKYTIDLNDTTFTIQKAIPDNNDIMGAYPYHDDSYWQGQITTSELYKDSVDYELKIYKNNLLVKALFPYNRINEPRFLYTEENAFLVKDDGEDSYLISRPYCDTIYRMSADSIFPAYQLVLPLENSLPQSFVSKPFKNRTERDNFKRNNGWMLRQVYGLYETSKYIFLTVSYLSNYASYIYQKKDNVTYKASNIKPDSSQYNLQLLGDYGTLRNGDKFYKPQKAGDLITFFEQNKNAPVPKELESFLKSKPHSTAPVIVEFKLKN